VIHASTEKRLLDQVRDRIRLKNYAYRTEKSYLYWIKQYILFHNKRHPNEMGGPEIEQFLTDPLVYQPGAVHCIWSLISRFPRMRWCTPTSVYFLIASLPGAPGAERCCVDLPGKRMSAAGRFSFLRGDGRVSAGVL